MADVFRKWDIFRTEISRELPDTAKQQTLQVTVLSKTLEHFCLEISLRFHLSYQSYNLAFTEGRATKKKPFLTNEVGLCWEGKRKSGRADRASRFSE